MSEGYAEFLDRKTQLGGNHGFAPEFVPDFLFDFQRSLVEWAVRKGRAAIFADCGLGKSPIELVVAENFARASGKPTLILTPLAVAPQFIEEAAKFGIEAHHSRAGEVKGRIVVANYERLHYFNPDDFGGVACDESSAIKSFDGARRAAVTDFMRKTRFRLLATATAAPNDYIELGTSSEALGELGHMDMLGRFFRNEQNNGSMNRGWRGQSGSDTGGRSGWRFKGHAEGAFWRWVCSWARAVRKPSDIGFDDGRFILPAFVEREHLVAARSLPPGMLFDLPAQGLWEERQETRRTLDERCEMAADLVRDTDRPAVVWCHLNDEGKRLAKMIPGAVEVAGADEDDEKEAKFAAFKRGDARVLISKPKIGAWGLNWQHCAHVVYFPSHSYEQYYQAVRRCWRFGQTRDVVVDVVTTKGGHEVMENLKRKAKQADAMFGSLVREMNNALAIRRSTDATVPAEVPSWLSSIKS